MKKVQILCFLLLMTFAVVGTVTAQQEASTAYAKKSLEIKKKYLKKILTAQNQWTTQQENGFLTATEDEVDDALTPALSSNTADSQAMEAELKLIEKLKTPADIQREKDRQNQLALEKTDKGIILKKIKNSFGKWNKKGEFEKEADFAERIKTKSVDTFFDVCLQQIKSRITDYKNDSNYSRSLSLYDSEGETFIANFKINGIDWQTKMPVPIANAEQFKLKWPDLKLKIGEYDWGFVENKLFPKTVTLIHPVDSTKYKFDLNLSNKSDIVYTFDEMKIINPHLTGYIFNYSNAEKILDERRKELRRLDSLEYVHLCTQLDSIFVSCNQTLLKNPYNTAQKAISSYQKLLWNATKKDQFKSSSNEIKTAFERLNNNFEKELEQQNPAEYCKVYYTVNADKKTESDKTYLEHRCNYTTRLDFDMDFIKGRLKEGNCRNIAFEKFGKYFVSKEEFNGFYDKGDIPLEEEATMRDFKSQAAVIEPLDFRDVIDKNSNNPSFFQASKNLLNDLTGIDLTNKKKEQLIADYLQKIAGYKEKTYYPRIIEFFINTNKGLNKEWTKNGALFGSKIEFYDAFISVNYKQIIKDKKK